MGKTHTLISAIFVKKDGAEFFKEVKKQHFTLIS